MLYLYNMVCLGSVLRQLQEDWGRLRKGHLLLFVSSKRAFL